MTLDDTKQIGCFGKLTAVLRSDRVKKEFVEFISAVRHALTPKQKKKT